MESHGTIPVMEYGGVLEVVYNSAGHGRNECRQEGVPTRKWDLSCRE